MTRLQVTAGNYSHKNEFQWIAPALLSSVFIHYFLSLPSKNTSMQNCFPGQRFTDPKKLFDLKKLLLTLLLLPHPHAKSLTKEFFIIFEKAWLACLLASGAIYFFTTICGLLWILGYTLILSMSLCIYNLQLVQSTRPVYYTRCNDATHA